MFKVTEMQMCVSRLMMPAVQRAIWLTWEVHDCRSTQAEANITTQPVDKKAMACSQQWTPPAGVQSSLSALPDISADLSAGTHTETAQEPWKAGLIPADRLRDAAIAATA